MRGTAAILRAPPSARRSTHSEIGGRESSMNPPSTAIAGSRSLSIAMSSWNSRAPRGSRLPCPTTRSAGFVPFLPILLAPFSATVRSRTSVLLVIYKRVQGRGGDRRTSLGTKVGDGGLPALQQLLL